MVGRHRQPAVRRRALGEDRRPEPLGDGRQGVRGPGLGDPAARQDRRPVGAGQQGGGPPQRLERRADAAVGDVGRGQVEPVGGLHLHVERQGEEDRAGRRREGGLDRPPDRGRDVLHPPDLGGPLGPGPGHGDQVGGQDRLLEQQPAVLLAGGHQQRRALAVGVVEHAQGVAQPAGGVDVGHGQAAGGHGEAVGHGHDRDLVEAEDVGEPRVVGQGVDQRQLGGAGVAEDVADAGAGEDLQERLDAAGGPHRPCPLSRRQGPGRPTPRPAAPPRMPPRTSPSSMPTTAAGQAATHSIAGDGPRPCRSAAAGRGGPRCPDTVVRAL